MPNFSQIRFSVKFLTKRDLTRLNFCLLILDAAKTRQSKWKRCNYIIEHIILWQSLWRLTADPLSYSCTSDSGNKNASWGWWSTAWCGRNAGTFESKARPSLGFGWTLLSGGINNNTSPPRYRWGRPGHCRGTWRRWRCWRGWDPPHCPSTRTRPESSANPQSTSSCWQIDIGYRRKVLVIHMCHLISDALISVKFIV